MLPVKYPNPWSNASIFRCPLSFPELIMVRLSLRPQGAFMIQLRKSCERLQEIAEAAKNGRQENGDDSEGNARVPLAFHLFAFRRKLFGARGERRTGRGSFMHATHDVLAECNLPRAGKMPALQ
jgi:hypothetical protein